ncbi:MAG TPA: YbaK/EbsC family protein, partial [Acidimicrobiia bacterium]|nr:YbaK/EbsC family protein [Acidimicrobiia bacterium]
MSSVEADLPRATRRFLAAAPAPIAGVRVFPEGTKTAPDAAAAVGCEVSAIVKSLVFVVASGETEEPVVALVPGDLRLDPAKL